jgi:RNase P subunit RPR2
VEELRAGDPEAVGPYRLLKRLGGGGMGQVFLGRSRRGRLVAVKVVRAELAADAQFRIRFAREVEAASRVKGFYTAEVVAADPAADPPWLATTYIPGPSLHEAVREQGPLPERALGLLAAGLAEGLSAVHTCGIVHRDLKPGNVLLAADGPRLIDFGIARAVEDTPLTQTGAAVGTPGFIAPEYLMGNKEAEPPADVFALGGVLVYAATGSGPFGQGGPHAVNFKAVYEEPDLASVPAGLASLIADCLAKKPEDRPTVTQILDRLPALDDTGLPWLRPRVTTMIGERDITPASSDSVSLADIEPEQAAAEARLAERTERKERAQEQLRTRSRKRGRRLLTQAEEVSRQIAGMGKRARTLAHLAAAVLPVDEHRAGRLIAEAEQCARFFPKPVKQVQVLAEVVAELAPADRRRARALADQAETLARGVGPKVIRWEALEAAAEGMASVDPARAEQIVRDLGDVVEQEDALYAIAMAMAPADPDRAERIARDLPDENRMRWLWGDIAEALAVTDPDRAESVARSIGDREVRLRTLKRLVSALAEVAPERAEQAAHSLPTEEERAKALDEVFQKLLHATPGRAELLARSMTDENQRWWRLGQVAEALAVTDPDRAETVARSNLDEEWQASALYYVFHALRAVDPRRAQRIARDIPASQGVRVMVLVETAEDLAGTDPHRARQLVQEAAQIAQRMADPESRAWAVGSVGAALAQTDPHRARQLVQEAAQIAQRIADPTARVGALLGVAETLTDTAPDQAAEFLAECERVPRDVPDPQTRLELLEEIVRAMVGVDPQRAARTAMEAVGIRGEDQHRYLASLADMLVDHVPDSAARIAVEAVHAARREHDGDEYNIYSQQALVTLAVVDARRAVHVATDTEFVTKNADEALEGLVRDMVTWAGWALERAEKAVA